MSFETELERDIDWRFEELACLRLQVSMLVPASVAERAALRALWAMLYAHYEGFCKFALDLYLDYLDKQQIVRGKLRPEIAAFSLESLFALLRGNTSRDVLWRFFESELPVALSTVASFDVKLETKSNLWPHLLKAHCQTMCLDVPTVDAESARLRALVYRRNEIAHGKPNVIKSLDEYAQYETAVGLVIYELALAIAGAVEKGGYLREL